MRPRVKNLVMFMTAMSLFSCRTMDKGALAPHADDRPLPATVKLLTTEEEEVLRKKIESWEGYMQFEGEADFSPYTLLRLTEGYLEAKEVFNKKRIEEYEIGLDQYNKGLIKTQPPMPVQDYSLLVSRFRVLKERFQYEKGGDAIHYILGYVLSEEGKTDESAKVFEELIKDYPESEYRMEVNFRLGELYYDTGQMGEAIEAYNRVTNFPDSVFYEKALYKLGWIYYKLDDFKKTVDTFMALLDRKWGEELAESGITEEAVSCIVLSMSRSSNLNKAIEYLESKGIKVYTPIILAKLGEALTEQVRYEHAVYVLKHLAESFPDAASRPLTCEKLASIYEHMGEEDKCISTRWELVNLHNPQTVWYRKNCTGDCSKIDELVSKTIVGISKKHHSRGKKDGNINDIKNAIKGYRLFLSSYLQLPESKEVRLLLAEALFDLKMYADAVKEYEKAAQLYPGGSDRGEIAYTMLLAYEILLLDAKEGKEAIVASVNQTVNAYRNDFIECGKLDSALYKLADMFAQTGSYDKARETLSPLLKGKDPIAAYQKTAELFIRENNFLAAEGIFSRLLERSNEARIRNELARVRYKIA